MRCRFHPSVEMIEYREKVPFAHMPSNAEPSVAPRRAWRTVCHCPVKGCIQVGLIETDFVPLKSKFTMKHVHA